MSLKQDILATLSYFDILDYPLTKTEIVQFLKSSRVHEEFITALNELISKNWVYKFEGFYMLRNNYSLVQKRWQGNVQAKALLTKAETIAGFLVSVPFVKGIAVSRSFLNTYTSEKSGPVFFIITAKNKLWLARTFIYGLKKLSILFKRQDWFCVNYYIDEEMLEIREKNIYTATKIATLIPLRGIDIFDDFFKTNAWHRDFLPNYSLRISYLKDTKNPLLKRIIESLLKNPIGDLMDRLLMNLSLYRQNKKVKSVKLNKYGAVQSADASRHHIKPNSSAFQKKFMEDYEKKIFNLFCVYESRIKTVF